MVQQSLNWALWNAHSVVQKKIEVESILHTLQLDVICITETWLTSELNFCIFGYNILRSDRISGRGGGVMILYKEGLKVERAQVPFLCGGEVDLLLVNVSSDLGMVSFLLVYCPPNVHTDYDDWLAIFDLVNSLSNPIVCGDFNAHHESWGSARSESRGRHLSSVAADQGFIVLNDSLPTFSPLDHRNQSNLDLIFVLPEIHHLFTWDVTGDHFGSDHVLITSSFSCEPSYCKASTIRYNVRSVDWSLFRERADECVTGLSVALDSGDSPLGIYDAFVSGMVNSVEASGGFLPSLSSRKCKSRPLWWSPECDVAIERRRESNRAYWRNQTRENELEARRVDLEVKWFLRNRKRDSFRSMCNELSPDVGLAKTWSVVRSLKSGPRGPRFSQDSSRSPEIEKLQDDLVAEEIPPVSVPRYAEVDESCIFNSPFSWHEFRAALMRENIKSAPGTDYVTWEWLRALSLRAQHFCLKLFNIFFVNSLFPEAWRNTRVIFIPKPGGKGFRPISLTSVLSKLMERLVHRRLEHFVEQRNIIPSFQFGFRRKRSSVDCVSTVVTDIMQGFSRGCVTLALAINIKGAFNNVRPMILNEKLRTLGVPERIVDFVASLTERRELFFSNAEQSRTCGVGVPQGGVLSPLLFNIYMADIGSSLPPHLRAAQYADDLLVYTRGGDVPEAMTLLDEAIAPLSDWLRRMGLGISSTKCVLCPFSSKRIELGDIFIEVDGSRVVGSLELKYLGILLDSRLTWIPHIKENVSRASKAINVLKVISKVSWGAAPVLALMVYRGLIRSYLEWGCQLYGSANSAALCMLDRVQNSALRVALGVMSTTPVAMLLSESNEFPLIYRRRLLTRRFIIRNFSWRFNPLIPKLQLLSERLGSSTCRMPVTIARAPLLSAYSSMRGILDLSFRSDRPADFDFSWEMITMRPDVQVDLFQERCGEDDCPSEVLGLILRDDYSDFVAVYTDGSASVAETSFVGSSFYIPESNFRFGVALQDFSSAYTAEAYAILSAILHSKRMNIPNVLILSDAKQVLHDVKNVFGNEPSSQLVYRILSAIHTASLRGQRISLMWIPSHKGLMGNDIADRTAKMAARTAFKKRFGLPRPDLLRHFDSLSRDEARDLWPFFGKHPKGLRYFSRVFFETRRPWFAGSRASRTAINFITRLRTGHVVCLDHFSRLGWRIDLTCPCGEEDRTLKHLFNECPVLSPNRPEFFGFLVHRMGIEDPEDLDPLDVVLSPTDEMVEAFGRFIGGSTTRIII